MSSSLASAPDVGRPQPRRSRGRLLRTILAVVLALALLEGATRYLVLADSCSGWGIARKFRIPSRFGRLQSDDAPSILHFLWLPPDQRDRMPPYCPSHDRRLGWTSDLFGPGDYAHVDESRVGDRRPILLFGDSYAAGVASPESRFQAQLTKSSLGARYALLNYGVPGYGLDQTYLLMREVLDRRTGAKPIVIVGLLVDDDLDRCILSFRNWPKPRLRVEGGRLVEPGGSVPTVGEYLAGHPNLPVSYAWTLLQSTWRDAKATGTLHQEAEKQELSRSILRAIVADLRRRELPFFFVLFNASAATRDPAVLDWRQPLVREELSALGAAWFEARDDILRACESELKPLGSFFRAADDHLSDLGNRATFQTIARGIASLGE